MMVGQICFSSSSSSSLASWGKNTGRPQLVCDMNAFEGLCFVPELNIWIIPTI